MQYQWDFSAIWTYRSLLWAGVQNTVMLAVLCLVLGMSFGLFVGAARYSSKPLWNYPATAFVEVFRNTPVLVQIVWFYFAFPIISPIDISSFTAATLALVLNTTAFSAEIFRAGIQSIAKGQWEAGRALGMTYSEQMRRVILPQAIRRMIPAFTNRGVELFKMTSLASVIAYGELMHQSKSIASIAFNPIEMYTAAAIIYFILIAPLAILVRRLETKINV
ncbi:amino acid ABC transporter permease [Pseudorhodobacter sp. W20_MBD10_FR17]|uniref:amino acid ABC transporter permease n=1 Tax=Pseudorhodobacter sp. W20_MBD10_FR17 TaxID=3240266 RepID=UPI003F95F081